ncbi:hypothetical protein BU24DRAFT_425451 [Aaosphaeria arxii CBS 175.79]|uniref:Heterokaryon incompatibility domain-containing protein n=1 Tax=Aaosphaeria arxii CBS 175.79 TaxID=1450172 RepID=A0A6A5XHV2_9PLEO|nr:uncharacterized protein BU24DRAFT_425451 [Aaosphaeria arxii CBS 175.79]KAF2012845.1 hypothetical protein BU24DRAFT_425451 [Aaosphaeria arxii CBS 175.79]
MDMQHDTSRTFRSIHGSLGGLQDHLSSIERKALHRTKQKTSDIHLKFLTLLRPQPKASDGEIHLRLTPLSEYNTSSPYVAVSYTWNQPAGLQDVYGKALPRYRIWTNADQPREPKCPLLVLHRAMAFARGRLAVPLIWIDQECIDQADNVDIENHLQVMDEIYQRSAFTAVILSRMIFRSEFFEALNAISNGTDMEVDFLTNQKLSIRRRNLHLALMHLAEDSWFTRTWTFQERHCAGPCFYLIPVDPELSGCERISDSFCVSQANLHAIWKTAERLSADKDSCSQLKDYNIIAHLSMLIKYRFDASRSNDHNPLSSTSTSELPLFYAEAFHGTERCDNDIVADRVAIFSNVCRFRWSLQSTLLRNPEISYSTCILALLILNFRAKTGLATIDDRLLSQAMDMTIGDFLRVLAEIHTEASEDQSFVSPFEEWLGDPGPQHLV